MFPTGKLAREKCGMKSDFDEIGSIVGPLFSSWGTLFGKASYRRPSSFPHLSIDITDNRLF